MVQHRTIEIRRHAKRNKPGPNLTAEGIRRACNASAAGRHYALVVTSNLPRAVQTAVAMGHGVDEEDWTMATMGAALADFPWEAGFAEMQRVVRSDPVAAAWMTQQAAQLRHWLTRIDPGEALLVVSHGGIAEVGVMGLLGDTDVATFGPSFDYCEGARMELDGEEVRGVRLLRFEGDREFEIDPFHGRTDMVSQQR